MTGLPPRLEVLEVDLSTPLALPFSLAQVPAGFPSPADDFVDRSLDLNEHLVRNPQATFFVRAYGESMLGAGIHDGDILVVDRSRTPAPGDIVIAALHGELTVKRIQRKDGKLLLMPENPDFSPIEIGEDTDFEIWGQVTYVIHKP